MSFVLYCCWKVVWLLWNGFQSFVFKFSWDVIHICLENIYLNIGLHRDCGFFFSSDITEFSIQSSFRRNQPIQIAHSSVLSWGKCYVQNPPFPISFLSLSLLLFLFPVMYLFYMCVRDKFRWAHVYTYSYICFSLCVQLYLCKCGGARMSQVASGGQRTTYRSQFCASTV